MNCVIAGQRGKRTALRALATRLAAPPLKLPPKPPPRRPILRRLALPLDIATARRSLIQNMIRRLN